MNYLHKFYFFTPAYQDIKRELMISATAIDFITRYKGSATECSRIQTSIPAGTVTKTDKAEVSEIDFISHVISGEPENANQIVLDGLLFKVTVQYVAVDGSMKRYTSWINPDNIGCLYQMQPDCTEIFFKSGNRIIVLNTQSDLMRNLSEHYKKYKERKKEKYGNPQKAGF
jgi:hypothetical protein